MTALKLTVFTPENISTASLNDAFEACEAVNAAGPAVTDCIRLTETMRIRFKAQRAGRQNRVSQTKPPILRIPFPTNDNMAPLRA